MSPLHTLSRRSLLFLFSFVLSACQTPVASPPPATPLDASAVNAAAQAVHPNLSGEWVFNPELSDKPEAPDKKAPGKDRPPPERGGMGGGPPGGGGPGGMGGHGPPGGGGPGGPGGGGAHGHAAPPMSAIKPAQRLSIEHQEPFIAISADGAPARKIYTDYRGVSVSASGSMKQQQTTAGWEADKLVLETVGNTQPGLTETYELHPESGQLWVTVQTQDEEKGQTHTFKQVYQSDGAR